MVHAAVKSHGNGLGQSCIIGRNGDFPYMGKMTGQVLQINAASGSKEKNSKSSHHYQDHGEYYSGVLADHTAGMEKTVGELIHFQSHLLKYLAEYRQDLCQEDKDHSSHHHQHEKGIGNCTFNIF